MATVTMPQLGESVTEGTVLKWLKRPGDDVRLDDPLCEIETEKVTAELPSPFEGIMGAVHVPQGETVQVGAPLCDVQEAGVAEPPVVREAGLTKAGGWSGGPMAIPADDGEVPVPVQDGTVVSPRERALPPAPVAGASAAGAAVAPPAAVARRDGERGERSRFYSPAVMRVAQERGIDLAAIRGTGIGGRVTRKDVDAAPLRPAPASTAASSPPAAPPRALAAAGGSSGGSAGAYEVVELSPTRRSIAENVRRSNLEAPQAWMMVEVDVTGLVRLREREKERFQAEEGVALTLLPYFAAAACEALRDVPMLNARWEGDELRRYHGVDLGIAVAAESGLVVPVLHGAGDLSVAGLARRIADLAARAHERRLRVEDIEGGTFTVNNTGAFGSIVSKPIVNHPQVAIVTMERAVKRPVVRLDDGIAIRWMLNACLSFDHRALDGLEAGGFMASLKRRLEAIA